jgi:hypothetical protein
MKKADRYIEQVLGEIGALRDALGSFTREQAATLTEMAETIAGSLSAAGSGGRSSAATRLSP